MSPRAGDILTQSWTFSVSGFNDKDLPLSYTFGYRFELDKGEMRDVWWKTSIDEDPSAVVIIAGRYSLFRLLQMLFLHLHRPIQHFNNRFLIINQKFQWWHSGIKFFYLCSVLKLIIYFYSMHNFYVMTHKKYEMLIFFSAPMAGQVTSLVRVCDLYDACTVMEGPTLTLSMPSQLPPDLIP